MAVTSQQISVAVVGAGPVGLYTALFLGRAGIDVTLYESKGALIDFPRAIIIHPLVLDDFKKTGVYDDVIDRSFVNIEGGAYYKPGGEILVAIDGNPDHPVIHCSQDRVQDVLFRHLQQQPSCKIIFNATLQTLVQENDGVTLSFIKDGEPLQVRAQFAVGTDGGRSTVRKQLGLPMDGYTWTDNVRVAADIDYDLKHAGLRPAGFVVDPVYYASFVKLGKGPGVRFDTGEPWPENRDDEWDEDQAKDRVRGRLRKIIGSDAAQAPIIRLAMYRAHQRCVPNFVKGRVALAGDAAHLTNPTGGLGLTSGILDAALLGRILVRILRHGEPYDKLLAQYDSERHDVFTNYVDPVATRNRKRVLGTTPNDLAERENFFARLREGDSKWFEAQMLEQQVLSSTQNMP